jgi:hypothetical protein
MNKALNDKIISMALIKPFGDGERTSKGHYLNGSGKPNTHVQFSRDKSGDLKVKDLIRELRNYQNSDNDPRIKKRIQTAFKKRPSLAEKMFREEGAENAMTLGEIARYYGKPQIADYINNLREGIVYKRQDQQARLHSAEQ